MTEKQTPNAKILVLWWLPQNNFTNIISSLMKLLLFDAEYVGLFGDIILMS